MSDIRDIQPLGPSWPVTPAEERKDQHREQPKRRTNHKAPPKDDGARDDGGDEAAVPGNRIDEYA